MTRKAKHSFTLIELLTVMAIIGILASMLIVAVHLTKKRTYIAKSKGELRELIKAWNAFWITYGYWPPALQGATNAPMTGDNIKYLLGLTDLPENPQKIKFLELGANALTEGFKDPWGRYYMVDFSRTHTPGEDVYQATVFFPQRKRYKYDNY